MTTAKVKCGACRVDAPLPAFTMAYQPIINLETSEIYAYEALYALKGAGEPPRCYRRLMRRTAIALIKLVGSKRLSWLPVLG